MEHGLGEFRGRAMQMRESAAFGCNLSLAGGKNDEKTQNTTTKSTKSLQVQQNTMQKCIYAAAYMAHT